ncbi:hypothetical protein L227DRAFT_94855 [Lentinus tigrinus ALCF2SS1-6]|uniref:Uncharacterized protein n=1 Tax=Lentinus tigrinus ALCF2SS1-6 TaxID=1328759 RepID=A0A5C2RM19_9APHY|nr:hypothetical protein L227DRAFT_94855 [Lentinus tigrinus ALCF2SS1-6]
MQLHERQGRDRPQASSVFAAAGCAPFSNDPSSSALDGSLASVVADSTWCCSGSCSASSPWSLLLKKRLLRRITRADGRGAVGDDESAGGTRNRPCPCVGEESSFGTTKSPCPCVGDESSRTRKSPCECVGDESSRARKRPCEWVGDDESRTWKSPCG